MRRNMSWVVALLALGLWIVPVGTAIGQETVTDGMLNADDANQGSGTQVNGDDWEYMDNALVGDGNQNAEIYGNANTGSGNQENTDAVAFEWVDIVNGNAGTGAQVIGSDGASGRDRDSSDVVMDLGDGAGVASAALEASVTGNAVIADTGGDAGSEMGMANGSGFSQMFGVSAVAASSGANASQNVSVNVTAQVRTATP